MYFTEQEWKCKCGCDIAHISTLLLYKLTLLRDMRKKAIILTSACRCPQHNLAVNGSKNSLHITTANMPCRAVDIHVQNKHDRIEIVRYASALHFSGIGIARNFIHLSYDETRQEGLFLYS